VRPDGPQCVTLSRSDDRPHGYRRWGGVIFLRNVKLFNPIGSHSTKYTDGFKCSHQECAMERFEIFMDSRGVFRWKLKAPNNEIIASSEGYLSKQGCQNGIGGVKEYAPTAEVVDLTLPPFSK